MIDAGRKCATCVFWSPRDARNGEGLGRCRARLLENPDPRLAFMTQASFVCRQWCGRSEAAE